MRHKSGIRKRKTKTTQTKKEKRFGLVEAYKLYIAIRSIHKMFTVEAGVKPWWESKINWTQILGALAMVLTVFGYTVPEATVPQAVAFIGALQTFATFVLRTWFTKDLTWNSVDEIESE